MEEGILSLDKNQETNYVLLPCIKPIRDLGDIIPFIWTDHIPEKEKPLSQNELEFLDKISSDTPKYGQRFG
jgi:hypothetical protein